MQRVDAASLSRGRSTLVAVVVTVASAIVLSYFILHLWHVRWRVPLYYGDGGDLLVVVAWVKAMLDDGWVWNTPHLGAPFAGGFADFPIPNLLHLLILRVLVTLTRDAGAAVNAYFILGFPLIATTALYCARRLGLVYSVAIPLALVFTFLPAHFMRNEAHLFYAQYFCVPFIILIAVWLSRNALLWNSATRRPTADGWIAIVATLLISWDTQYDVFFAAIMFALAAVTALIRYRSNRSTLAFGALLTVMILGVFIEIAPYKIYEVSHGKSDVAIIRPPEGAEEYGLTLAQMMLPINGHRIAGLAEKRAFYDAAFPVLVNENGASTLGILGTLGFVGGILWFAFAPLRRDQLWADLARINLGAFFLATVGGVGALISYYFVPEIRAYNRISPLIAFTSLMLLGLILDAVRRRYFEGGDTRRWLAAAAIVVAIGVFDQTSSHYQPRYEVSVAKYDSDEGLATTLERMLPPGASVYQAPHVPFPESPSVVKLGSWQPLALFLHSHDLKYSFGTTRGRPSDDWEVATDVLPPRERLARLLIGGFDAVASYRDGFADHGALEEAALTTVVGHPPLVSEDGSIAVYDISRLRTQLLAAIGGPAAGDATRAATLTMGGLTIEPGSGFSSVEVQGDSHWTWAASDAHVTVTNASTRPVRASVRLFAATGVRGPAHLDVIGGGEQVHATIRQSGTPVQFVIAAPPGTTDLALHSDVARLRAPNDPRDIRFRLLRWDVQPERLAAAQEAVDRILDQARIAGPETVATDWSNGCYQQEDQGARSWHWCQDAGSIRVENRSRSALDVTVTLKVSTPEPGNVVIGAFGTTSNVQTDAQGRQAKFTGRAKPGSTTITLRSNVKPVVSADPRRMVIRIDDFFVAARPLPP